MVPIHGRPEHDEPRRQAARSVAPGVGPYAAGRVDARPLAGAPA
jgi:hypothetical protein